MTTIKYITVCILGYFVGCSSYVFKNEQGQIVPDSTDIRLITLSFENDAVNMNHAKYGDSSTQKSNIYVVDTLIKEAWLPGFNDIQYIVISPEGIDDLVRRKGELSVIKFGGLYNYSDSISKGVVIVEMDCFYSKKYHRVIKRNHEETTYKYKLSTNGWNRDGSQMIIRDFPAIE